MNFNVIKLDTFILNGIYREFSKEEIPDIFPFWESLDMNGMIEKLEKINDFKAIDGFLGACLKQVPSENLRYLVSVASTTAHPDFTSVEIPASDWVVFDVPHTEEKNVTAEILKAFDYIYQVWFKENPYKPLPTADLEYYQLGEQDGPGSLLMKVYIPVEAI